MSIADIAAAVVVVVVVVVVVAVVVDDVQRFGFPPNSPPPN